MLSLRTSHRLDSVIAFCKEGPDFFRSSGEAQALLMSPWELVRLVAPAEYALLRGQHVGGRRRSSRDKGG